MSEPPRAEEQQSSFSVAQRHRYDFLSFRNLNALVVTVVFSASGLISVQDLAFVLFSFLYMFFISRIAFPCFGSPSTDRVFDRNSKVLRLYMLTGALIGLFLPVAYILEGILEGDKEGIKASAPHLFLLASQIFAEGVAASGSFSIPIQVFVPVFFNSRRIFTIVDWMRTEIGKAEEDYGGSVRRLYVGRALAIANMAFWCFNLFGFLLPVYLPRAFKKYYIAYNEKHLD